MQEVTKNTSISSAIIQHIRFLSNPDVGHKISGTEILAPISLVLECDSKPNKQNKIKSQLRAESCTKERCHPLLYQTIPAYKTHSWCWQRGALRTVNWKLMG
jgi:hypothetical protein